MTMRIALAESVYEEDHHRVQFFEDALVLAGVGIYGLMSYSVSRRAHEIGVRVALGAGQRDVLRLTLGKALFITLRGMAIGLILAVGAGKLMASNLFGVVSMDPVTFVGFALVLTVVSLLAATSRPAARFASTRLPR